MITDDKTATAIKYSDNSNNEKDCLYFNLKKNDTLQEKYFCIKIKLYKCKKANKQLIIKTLLT